MQSATQKNTTKYIIIGVIVLLILIGGGVAIWWFSSGDDVKIKINPDKKEVAKNSATNFTAEITGTNDKKVNWSVNDDALGMIDKNGKFTAKADSGTVNVTVTSVKDPTKKSSATVTLKPASNEQITIQLNKKNVDIGKNKTYKFNATVTGTNNNKVNWSTSNSTLGTIDANGLFTAKDSNGTTNVIATSDANANIKSIATVRIVSDPSNGGNTNDECVSGDFIRCEKKEPTVSYSHPNDKKFEMMCANGEYIESLSTASGALLHGIGAKCNGMSGMQYFGGLHDHRNNNIGWKYIGPGNYQPPGGYNGIKAWSSNKNYVGKIQVTSKKNGEVYESATDTSKGEKDMSCGEDGFITGIFGTTNNNMISSLGVRCSYSNNSEPKPVPQPEKDTCAGGNFIRCERKGPTENPNSNRYNKFELMCANGEYIDKLETTSGAGLHGIGAKCSGSNAMQYFGGRHGHPTNNIGWSNGNSPDGYRRIHAWVGREWESVGKTQIYDKKSGVHTMATREDQPESNMDCTDDGIITGIFGLTDNNMINSLGIRCSYKK